MSLRWEAVYDDGVVYGYGVVFNDGRSHLVRIYLDVGGRFCIGK